jgi:hypothetical protein
MVVLTRAGDSSNGSLLNATHNRCKPLRKNAGQDTAIMAGLNVATGEVVVIMDENLQHDPSDIPALDTLGKPKNIYMSPYKALRREVVQEVIKYAGPYPYNDGLIFSVTTKFSSSRTPGTVASRTSRSRLARRSSATDATWRSRWRRSRSPETSSPTFCDSSPNCGRRLSWQQHEPFGVARSSKPKGEVRLDCEKSCALNVRLGFGVPRRCRRRVDGGQADSPSFQGRNGRKLGLNRQPSGACRNEGGDMVAGGTRPLLMFPCNGNGLEALHCLDDKFQCIGFVDDDPEKQESGRYGYRVFDRMALNDFPEARFLPSPEPDILPFAEGCHHRP